MNPSRSGPESRLDRLTRRWWFYLIIVFITFLPLYSQKPYDPRQTSQVINEVLMRPLIYSIPRIFPLFKVIPIILIVWLFVQPRKAYRWFALYAGINLIGIALLQNTAFTPQYGLVIIIGNVVLFGAIGSGWFLEAWHPTADFSARPLPACAFLLFPLMLVAFWMPVQSDGMRLDFNPWLFFTNEAGLTGCMMLTVYTGIQAIFYPDVNLGLMRSAIPNLKTGETETGRCGKLIGKILSEQTDYLYVIDFGQDDHSIKQALAECTRCAQGEQ